jgi:hypothetical protein
MFRRYNWNPHDLAEMSFEQTVEALKSYQEKPKGVSEETWALVRSSEPRDEDSLADLHDLLLEDISNISGGTVLTLAWSGEGMAHSGIKSISSWGDFFVFGSSDHDDHGPFRKIEDALDLEYFWQEGVPGGELWFDSKIVPTEIVMKIAHAMCGDDGETVFVNGMNYVRRAAQLYAISE